MVSMNMRKMYECDKKSISRSKVKVSDVEVHSKTTVKNPMKLSQYNFRVLVLIFFLKARRVTILVMFEKTEVWIKRAMESALACVKSCVGFVTGSKPGFYCRIRIDTSAAIIEHNT